MRLLEESRQSRMHLHDKRSWEILHEEIGFIDSGPGYDRDLIDLDGAETHLTHAMHGHSPRERQRSR